MLFLLVMPIIDLISTLTIFSGYFFFCIFVFFMIFKIVFNTQKFKKNEEND